MKDQPKPASKPNPGLQQFASALGEAAKKAREKRVAQEGPETVSGGLSKPDQQELADTYIAWTWNGLPGCYVEACFQKHDGSYTVAFAFSDDRKDIMWTAEEAKKVGEALLSASIWENSWQQHAGEYLAIPPTLKAVPEPVIDTEKPVEPKPTARKRNPRKRPPQEPS